ncbi:Purple acid phosphatase-like N-terminal [Penicillium expansum]|nr:Purple acid phosphatase-like N-terminal [Penicillium expansum]
MGGISSLKLLPFVASCAFAGVKYPQIPTDLTTPFQQRLSVYGPDAVSVAWNTYGQLEQSCVSYGLSENNLNTKACSSLSTTYDPSRTWSNVAVLTGLTPATTYYYKIESTNSTVNHFLSPRTPGDKTPFNMDVVIDLGVYGKNGFTSKSAKKDTIPVVEPELNHTTIGRLAKTIDDYELVIHPGDFGYADDWYLKFANLFDGKEAYEAIIEQFYDQLAPIAGRKPYMASPGNHEADCSEIPLLNGLCPKGQNNFTEFMHRYEKTMPQAFVSSSTNTTAQTLARTARNLSNPPFWYSFEYGMAHVVMINTETDFPNAPSGKDGSAGLNGGPFGTPNQQLDFLKADLASVDREPWYSTGGSSNICSPCQEAFEGLFYQYGVDLGVFGHVHNSQRFAPVVNGTADPNGMEDPKAPMYIIAGGPGNIEGLSSIGSKPAYTEFAYADDFSYSTLRFLDEQHLQVDFVRSSTGEIVDSSTLFKKHATDFVDQ